MMKSFGHNHGPCDFRTIMIFKTSLQMCPQHVDIARWRMWLQVQVQDQLPSQWSDPFWRQPVVKIRTTTSSILYSFILNCCYLIIIFWVVILIFWFVLFIFWVVVYTFWVVLFIFWAVVFIFWLWHLKAGPAAPHIEKPWGGKVRFSIRLSNRKPMICMIQCMGDKEKKNKLVGFD